MCKKLCIGVVAVLLVLTSNNSMKAQEGQVPVPRDILLVYDDGLTGQEHDNVAAIADTLTYMGYGVAYSTVGNSKGKLQGYTHILLYHEKGELGRQFTEELRDTRGKIMTVGGGDIAGILSALELPVQYANIKDATARLTYSFSSGKVVSELINLPQMNVLQAGFQKSSGEITADGQRAPVFAGWGRFSNIAAYDSGSDVLKAILAEQVSYWKWPYRNIPASYAQYVVFDEVYPFTNQQKLMALAEMMREMGIPYGITVLPVYRNIEYPSMKHFCEVLRYAQDNGAAIFLKVPFMNTNTPKVEDINKRISIAFSAYTGYGIYPVAIQAPNNWIHEKTGQEVLRRFRTVVLTPDTGKNNWTDTAGYNTVYSDGHQFIAPALAGGEPGENMVNSYSTAIMLNAQESVEEIRRQIEGIRHSNIEVKSLWSSNHSVYTDDSILACRNKLVILNNKPQSLAFVPFEYEENFSYNRGIIGQMAEAIARENRRLLILVSIICIIFLTFIGMARLQNRRRFLYRDDTNPSDEEDKD